MKWSEKAWEQSNYIYEEIIKMPFIESLIKGTLPLDRFQFYIEQDSIYLAHFGRTLSLIAARANDTGHVLDFIRFAEGAIVVENALHAGYFKQFEIEGKASISPTCHHYTSFLLSTASLAQVEVAMAAVLPCFWIYKKVGDYIYQQKQVQNNPYQTWIDTYAGEDFGILVAKAIGICDTVAEQCTPQQQNKMLVAFEKACHLEWQFWHSAWRLERWDTFK